MQEPDDASHASDRRSRIRDREGFADVFRTFHAPLVRYARGITEDLATAEDVVQDVFTKLWRDRKEHTVEVSLKALLYTMVRNRALNANRDNRKIASDVNPEDMDERHRSEPATDEVLSAEHLRERIRDWIDDLPPRRKEAFLLSRYHSFTHKEIASIMGVAKRTVDTHILLALRELRKRLDELRNENPSP